MTTIRKPPDFNDEWLSLLKLIAIKYPEITAQWEKACDNLVLLKTGLPIFGSKGNKSRTFARQRIAHYKSGDRNPRSGTLNPKSPLYVESYNPLDFIDQEKFLNFINKESRMSRRSPNRSTPRRTGKSKISRSDLDVLCDATSSMHVGGAGLPKLRDGINFIDGNIVTVSTSMQTLPNGAGLQKVTKVAFQLPSNCINSKTRKETAVCLSSRGTLQLSAPLSFGPVSTALQHNRDFSRKAFVGNSDEAGSAWAVVTSVEEGDWVEAEDEDDWDRQRYELEVKLPECKDAEYTNNYYNDDYNRTTKERDIPPPDASYLFPLVDIQAADVALDNKGRSKATISIGLVTVVIAIEGSGCFKPNKGSQCDSEDEDDFYSNMLGAAAPMEDDDGEG